MKVLLRNDWFGPDANLYARDFDGTEIPEMYRDMLPSTAKIVEDDYKSPAKKSIDPKTLSEMGKMHASGPLDKAKK